MSAPATGWQPDRSPTPAASRHIGTASVLALLLFAAMCIVPQVFLKPITGNDDVSTIDILSVLILSFVVASGRIRLEPPQMLAAAFIFFLLAVYAARAVFDVGTFLGRASYIGRTVSILSIVSLVPYLPRSEAIFGRTGVAVAVVSLGALLYMITMYSAGSAAFDAHQTLAGQDGTLYNRLGGLPGESGAYAFNAVIVAQLAFLFLVLRGGNIAVILGSLATILFVTYMSFKLSQARIMIMNIMAFAGCIYLFHPASLRAKVLLLIPAAALAAYTLAFGLNVDGGLLVRFSGSNGDITSGRIAHWIDVSDFILHSPATLLFGIGNRMTNVVFSHVVENFFLYFVLEYGLIGLGLFMAMILVPLRRIYLSALRSGNTTSVALVAVWVATFVQWQVNDVITYYQTFPLLLGFTCWWYRILGPDLHTGSARPQHPSERLEERHGVA